MCWRKGLFQKTMHNIKTFVFMDLETTGLPSLENNKTKVTELCLIAVQAAHLELGCWPRVLNKLSICLYPNRLIDDKATKITGLSNDLLEQQACFTADTLELINKFLALNKPPICLVAHNGYQFDYPIFKTELFKVGGGLPDDILCIDTLVAFRDLDKPPEPIKRIYDSEDEFLEEAANILTPAEQIQKINETTPKKQVIKTGNSSKRTSLFNDFVSYKLADIYTRLTKRPPIKAHEAEADVAMLIHCSATYAEKFVEYANKNAKLLRDVPMMKPGIRIGK